MATWLIIIEKLAALVLHQRLLERSFVRSTTGQNTTPSFGIPISGLSSAYASYGGVSTFTYQQAVIPLG